MRNKIIGMLFFAISIFGCKSVKISSSNINKGMTANNVIENHYDKAFNKETIIAKLKVKYIGKSNLPGVTASLRVKKDETIWISIYKLGFPIGKALITPQRVSYYEKINRTYFD
ncbi:MAG: DUF4292 domain-containing protein, partial [Aureibaculum sp.]